MTGCSGERISPEERAILKEYRFGGTILLRRNCVEPRQLLALCRSLRESAAGEPRLIAIDEEGGAVHRLPPPFTHFPAPSRIGVRRDPDLAYRAGRACGAELALAGIHLNFAPVLDVNSEPGNPVIGDRAFGCDAQSVSTLALAWSRGLRDSGVLPCGKHFPGHGATTSDSHSVLPSVDKAAAELEALEFRPFVDACRSNIETLMTAHVKFATVDPCYPATLSETIVTGLLRKRFGYRGVVFTDDLEMKAVSDHYSAGEAALLAFRAGVDILLYGGNLEKAVEAFECVYTEAERSPALRTTLEIGHERILELKRRHLKSFDGAAGNEIEARLARLGHGSLVAEIHGNL